MLSEEQKKEYQYFKRRTAEDIVEMLASNASSNEKTIFYDKCIKSKVLTSVQFHCNKYSGVSIAAQFFVECSKAEENTISRARGVLKGLIHQDAVRRSGILLDITLDTDLVRKVMKDNG